MDRESFGGHDDDASYSFKHHYAKWITHINLNTAFTAGPLSMVVTHCDCVTMLNIMFEAISGYYVTNEGSIFPRKWSPRVCKTPVSAHTRTLPHPNAIASDVSW